MLDLTLPETKPNILYIDDDPINRSLVNRLLTTYDFQVIEAETGLEGLQIARQMLPDLILMDINMPGLDGHETRTRMRSITGMSVCRMACGSGTYRTWRCASSRRPT